VRRRSPLLKASLTLLVLLAILAAAHPLYLPLVAGALVRDDGPAKADIAVVLGGDYSGSRIRTAAGLVRAGWVPAVLVSGPAGFYGRHECDFSIPYAAAQGYPAEWFIAFPNQGLSTAGEAVLVLAELRRRNVHSFLLVTSDYHTARAARQYRALERASGGGPALRAVAAPDEYFHPAAWWRSREDSKTVFFEWCKTLATAVGI
jgi:uncharacterized SAM-binding protein YcdF (DUF218 family)